MSGEQRDPEILPEWEQAVNIVLARPSVVASLGASDSGKTTLSRFLAERWGDAGRTVALVDGDIGQSSIGPPATVGLAVLSPYQPLPLSPCPQALYFVGATSPPGHFLPHVLGTQKLVRVARVQRADIVLVDTTGLISGAEAASLKWHKLQAIRPQHILALQRAGELEPILHLVEGLGGVQIHRLPVSGNAVRRGHAARRAHREARFREYFLSATNQDLEWKGLRFSRLRLNCGRHVGPEERIALGMSLETVPLYAEILGEEGVVFVRGSFSRRSLYQVRNALQVSKVLVIDVEQMSGALLGLHDTDGAVLALGILQDFDPELERLRIFTPLQDSTLVRDVAFGSLRLEANGRELDAVSWR